MDSSNDGFATHSSSSASVSHVKGNARAYRRRSMLMDPTALIVYKPGDRQKLKETQSPAERELP